jgi:hypothetical protein
MAQGVKQAMERRGFALEGTGGGCDAFIAPPGRVYTYMVTDTEWGSQAPTRMTDAVTLTKTLNGECESEAEKPFPSVTAFLKWWDAGNRL